MNYSEYDNCHLCPKRCGAKRNKGLKGLCGADNELRVGRASLHMWEEPCISGSKGSGTVFFSGCTLRCIYCQNFCLSRGEEGVSISTERLAEIFLELEKKGAHNINLVTGEHFAPHIRDAIKMAKKEGLQVPVVFNCGGYTSMEVLELLDGFIDIYLADFKYMDDDYSEKYSGVKNYSAVCRTAVKEMVRQQPKCVFDEDGIMKKGVIIRHLCLPGLRKDSEKIIKYLFENYGHKIFFSIMNQYTPNNNEKLPHELRRRLNEKEYDNITEYAVMLGIENAYVQEEGTAEESFIPEFNGFGVI